MAQEKEAVYGSGFHSFMGGGGVGFGFGGLGFRGLGV